MSGADELLLVGIAPIRGRIHRVTKPLRRPGWAVTVCGIRKRLVPADWRKPEDAPCGDCFEVAAREPSALAADGEHT